MIPVYQTEFTKLDDKGEYVTKGNCFCACLASLFELPIRDIPRIQDYPPDGSWFQATWDFADKHGLELSVKYDMPDGYSIANGPSPRGKWGHSVVYFKDQLIHDPYPNGKGLTKVEYFLTLIPKINEQTTSNTSS